MDIIPARKDYIGQSLRDFNESGAPERFGNYFKNKEKKKKLAEEDKFFKEEYGIDLSKYTPETRSVVIGEKLKSQGKIDVLNAKNQQINDILNRDEPSFQQQVMSEPQAKGIFKPEFEQKESFAKPKSSKKRERTDEQILELASIDEGIARIVQSQKTDSEKKADRDREHDFKIKQAEEKKAEERRRALRQETLPIRTELSNKARFAEKGIQNKEQLLDLVRKGDLDDPTYAALAQNLPLGLGKRLLSNDTVEYKAGLVEEFGDLRNIFQGQTRIKEIDLLEDKIADLYLTDDQKEAVIKSRINALRADIIRAEAAAELEDREDLGALKFSQEVEKRAKPKLEALFHQILDDQRAIIDSAERRKNSDLPLDPNDADDLKILQQILKEARGDKQEARKIAQKKGYKF